MSKLKSFFLSKTAQNTYYISMGNIIGLLLATIFFVVTYRLMPLSDFGYLSALWALLLLTSEIADLGIGSSLSRFLPPLEEKRLELLSFLKTAFLFQLTIGLFVFFAFFISASIVSHLLFHDFSFASLVRITSFGIFLTILANFFLYALSARQKFIQAAIVTVIGAFSRVLLLVIFFVFSTITLVHMAWAQAISFLLPVMVGLTLIRPGFLMAKRAKDDFKKLLSFSSFLGVARSITAVASRLDILMLVALLSQAEGATEAGIYAGAVRFTALYPLFVGSFGSVIAPRIAVISDQRYLRQYFKKVVIATIGLIASIFLFIALASPFLLLILGEKGALSVPVLQLLLVAQIFFVASIPAVNLAIYYLKKPQILTINSLLQLVIVILGNYLMIPHFTRFAPALSLLFAYGASFILTSYLSLYYLRKIDTIVKFR